MHRSDAIVSSFGPHQAGSGVDFGRAPGGLHRRLNDYQYYFGVPDDTYGIMGPKPTSHY